jgi:hypothetical protein
VIVFGGERCGSVIGWFYGVPYEMRFADPGALGVWEDDGDGVAIGLEG